MKQRTVNTMMPQRDSVSFLESYTISPADLEQYHKEQDARDLKRRDDRRQRRRERERLRSGSIHF